MGPLAVTAIILSLTSLSSIINQRWLRVPATMGLLTTSIVAALLASLLQLVGFAFVGEWSSAILASIDLSETH